MSGLTVHLTIYLTVHLTITNEKLFVKINFHIFNSVSVSVGFGAQVGSCGQQSLVVLCDHSSVAVKGLHNDAK